MIYYKNILLNISNGLNSRRVSTAANPYADKDAQILACACMSDSPVTASNGQKYYYFCDNILDTNMIQYLLNCNGVLAYRRYSGYLVFYGERRPVVRVPAGYVASHPNADAFIKKIINSESSIRYLTSDEETEYINLLKARMHQK